MAKKKSWCSVLKRLIVLGREARLEKAKRKRPIGRLRIKWLALFSAPPHPKDEHEACREEELGNHATMVIASAATNAADSVPFVPGGEPCYVSQPAHHHKEEISELSENPHLHAQKHCCNYDIEIQTLASIKIQTAFRGYLARKALRALKGLVRLQAIIRGHAVRRQTIATLKRLQSIVNIQSEVCAQRCNLVNNTTEFQENQYQDLRERDIKIDLNSQKRWDNRVLSKAEANAMFLTKRDAAIRRERIREYWLSHRRSAESEQTSAHTNQRYWLQQWVDAQLAKREDLENLGTVFSASARMKDRFDQREAKPNMLKQYKTESLMSPIRAPRRSFNNSIGDDSPVASPAVPTYMAATESAKARARSLSSPRLRPTKFDAYSEINSPYKYRLSPISSINSEVTITSRVLHPTSLSQRSPCLKSAPGPVRSSRSLKNISLEQDL
ncbi:PREDICTED: protein IQ-DOMAIN 14 [Ipomoea nil]|uniref:protein IQ-DOMAIN 14 n=1 Tax=Ipomoea nil TaxID=35883 RepID=UPI0009016F4D|nr:PREDICTED: protein IQ-DOMAIN 14 [Ipomoea nil]